MSVDIITLCQKKNSDGVWEEVVFPPRTLRRHHDYIFENCNHNVHDFFGRDLVGMKIPFDPPHPRGVPEGVTIDDDSILVDGFGFTWVSVEELSNFNYNLDVDIYYGTEKHSIKLAALLGEDYFIDLSLCKKFGVERIAIGFD